METQVLFYGGLALLAAGAVGSVAAVILFHISGRKLQKKLNSEYGNKRH